MGEVERAYVRSCWHVLLYGLTVLLAGAAVAAVAFLGFDGDTADGIGGIGGGLALIGGWYTVIGGRYVRRAYQEVGCAGGR